MGSIRPDVKKTAGRDPKAEELLKHRSRIIEQQLRSLYDERPNILTCEIDPKRALMQERPDELEDDKQIIRAEDNRATKILDRGTIRWTDSIKRSDVFTPSP